MLFFDRLSAVLLICALFYCGGVPNTAESAVRNPYYGGLENTLPVYYPPAHDSGGAFYIGANGATNMLNFKLSHRLESNPSVTINDSYSFEQQFGFGIAAGYQFGPKWRMQLEYSYNGKFNDEDDVAHFTMSSQNIILGARYNFYSWANANLYGGLGGGLTLLSTRLTGVNYANDGNETQSKTVFAAQAVLGIEEFITPNFAVGLEYSLGLNGGMNVRRYDVLNDDYLAIKVGNTLTNSLKLGLRYKF